jgi:molybdopterin-guanine dinucleotide biosynthesis protein A
MQRHAEVEGFILAGSESGRMGRDKSLLELGGVALLQRTARLIEPLVARIAILGPVDRYASFSLRTIPDVEAGAGPLGAIATALRHSVGEWNLIVACDLPYLTADWLDFLIRRALASKAHVLLPHTEGGPEPLSRCTARAPARRLPQHSMAASAKSWMGSQNSWLNNYHWASGKRLIPRGACSRI